MSIERDHVVLEHGDFPPETCWAVVKEVLFEAEFAGLTPREARALIYVLVHCDDALQVSISPGLLQDMFGGYAPSRRELRGLARKGVIRLHEPHEGSYEIQLVRKFYRG